MLRTLIAFVHLMSGKVFWFVSSYVDPKRSLRLWVENRLIAFYRWELHLYPDLADAYSKIGSLLSNRKQFTEAVVWFDRALRAGHPDRARIHYFCGRQKAALGDIPGAVNCFTNFVQEEASSINPGHDRIVAWKNLTADPEFDPHRFHGYSWMGRKCVESGLSNEAIGFFNKSIILEPLVIQAHELLAETLYRHGNRQEALKVTSAAHNFHLRQQNPIVRISFLERKTITKPDFMILGKQKCGTTSLHRYLTAHPSVAPALSKEVRFFNKFYGRGLEWYLAQFPPIGKRTDLITGEASANYIDSETAARRIMQHFPRTRFIILLRNPAERAVSHYKMNCRLGLETASMEDALLAGIDSNENHTGNRLKASIYIQTSIYVTMIRFWMDLFPPDQFLVLSSESLFARSEEVTNQVYRFLGLSPFQCAKYPVENRGEPAVVEPPLLAQLTSYFVPHNRELESFLGKRFGWDD